MPSVSISPQPKLQFFDANGAPLAGGKLYSYDAGTTTPRATYTSSSGNTANTNPVILDSRGEASVWMDSGAYKLALYTSTDVLVWTVDNLGGNVSLAQLAASGGSSLIGFIQSGAGAVTRTAQSKMRESVSVMDFGAVPGVDMSAALQAAVDALPAEGGEIYINAGAWVLDTDPSLGTKSIVWNIDPGATFSGAGIGTAKFLSMATNPNQLAAGPYIRSQSTLATPSAIGGIGAFSVEMIQPSTYSGSSVALYAGASSASSQPVADVWAINGLVKALAGATGNFQCAELDVDTFASGATTKGIGLNGVGDYNATVGIELQRADATKWEKAIHILNSLIGIQIESAGLDIGLLINGPVVSPVTISVGQIENNTDTILVTRKTNTTPTGYYMRFVDATNSSTIFGIDVNGNINSTGSVVTSGGILANIVTGANLRANTSAVSGGAGVLAIGSTSSTTATAGALTLPANPLGFLEAYLGTTLIKIPYYAA